MESSIEFTAEEESKIEKEFNRLKVVYLDCAGSVLYSESQISSVCDVFKNNFYPNPHTSKATENLVDQIRLRVLKHFHINSHDDYSIIFTSNCTAALKIIGESFQFGNNGGFYYLTDSHTSVLGLREIVNTERIIPLSRDCLKESVVPDTIGDSLFAFPAQCNFNGYKYPLSIIEKIHKKNNNYVLLDAAAFASSNDLDLSLYKPDYVTLSFYKIFGYPTGLAALFISNRGAQNLRKKYYGGGTIKIALTRDNWHQKKDGLHEIYEDGTLPFLEIISIQNSFKYMDNLLGESVMKRISRHVYSLGKYFYENLKSMKHYNDEAIAIFYHDNDFNDINLQGGIVNFNLKHSNGAFIGYAEFASIATLHNIIIRTGCFCNPGSCQTFLNLSNEDVLKHFKAGHVCGDENDLVNGMPTGSIRVSFGYMNNKEDADALLKMIETCYVQKEESSKCQNGISNTAREESTAKPKLKSIRIFPIKSCGPMVIENEWELTGHGLKYDREWMIINGDNGTAITQKHETKMCLIRPTIDKSKNILRLEFPYLNPIELSLDSKIEQLQKTASMCRTKVCNDVVNGFDCGQEVADWLSDALNINNLRLIRQSDEVVRKSGNIALANQAQFLLINKSSVQWLMDQVEAWDYEKNIDNVIDRFRGNFIIENIQALEENSWEKIKIGENILKVQGLCTRCQMVCIDQNTGEKTAEPLRTIGKIFQGKTKFGVYLKMSDEDISKEYNTTIQCGDEILIL